MTRVHKAVAAPVRRPVRRPRDAGATRSAILASARAAFAQAGYDGAGVREIAARAGVSAMLINRYFGSKEKLFAEVVADTIASPVILTPETLQSGDIGAEIARALVALTRPGAAPLDGFQVMLRSVANPRAAAINRDQIERHHQKNLSGALAGPHAAERAALVLALVAGIQLMRQTLAIKALAKADPALLTRLITPLVEALVAPSKA